MKSLALAVGLILSSASPILAQTATSTNSNLNSAAATSSGAATNSQSILASPSTQAIGGDVNNTIIQPAFGLPSVNRIGRNEVQCQGPSLGFSGGVYPNDNQGFYDTANFEPQFSVALTFPLGGGQAYCRGIAAKLEEQKAIEVNLNRISASASIIKTCLEMQKQGVDLEALDPTAIGVNFKQLCATVKIATTAATEIPQFVPAPPSTKINVKPGAKPLPQGYRLLKPINAPR